MTGAASERSVAARSAGNKSRSPINAANSMADNKIPNRTVGKNPQNAYRNMLKPQITLVWTIAEPTCVIAFPNA